MFLRELQGRAVEHGHNNTVFSLYFYQSVYLAATDYIYILIGGHVEILC